MHPECPRHHDHTQRGARPSCPRKRPHPDAPGGRKAVPSCTPCCSSGSGAAPGGRSGCPPHGA
eukprot:71290-Alexandrium_andersonii.AAC.1